jgi:mono/diheme cytochrome c family protein
MRLVLVATLLMSAACWESGGEPALPLRYSRIEVPSESRLASSVSIQRGAALFAANCVLCHGVRADGNGVRSQGLSSRPRDFTDPAWRERTSPRRIFFAIREGLHGTPMPGWKSFDDEQTWDLVAYVRSVSEGGTRRR